MLIFVLITYISSLVGFVLFLFGVAGGLALRHMVLEVLRYELNRSLHRENSIAFALLLLLHQREDGVVKQGAESVVEEFPNRHLLMVVLVLDELKQVVEHVLVRARLNSIVSVVLGFVLFLDLLHEHLALLLEHLVTLSCVLLVSWLELDFDYVCVSLK